jgi:hypothetical protein
MAGYIPLFDSLITGTLGGHWPDVGLWPIVLSLTNKHGVVDVTLEYLSKNTGLPLDEVTACMRRFCEPDPGSRSTEEGGARLKLIEPKKRNWGWMVVNHAKYREKARLMAKSANEVADGRNRDRMNNRREPPSRTDDRPSPPQTAVNPLSNPDANTNIKDSRPQKRTTDIPQFHQEVIKAYEEILPNSPRVKIWTSKRRRNLDARIRERHAAGLPADSVDYWQKFFQKVAASDFLTGRTGTWRGADLEWLTSEANFLKVIEGNYDKPVRGEGAMNA